jgi:phosphatidylinositol-3-phosphatase
VDFEGKGGLFDDLRSGHVPQFSFIAPNQCNDQHGRSNAGPQCDFDPNDNGTQTGLNPALIALGDLAVQNIIHAIHDSPAWQDGRSAIVVLWDENDYSFAPNCYAPSRRKDSRTRPMQRMEQWQPIESV